MKLSAFFTSSNRSGRFAWTVSGSFVNLVAAATYSFLLIPLVLHFENSERLGLWLLISQVASSLLMIDAGVTPLSIRQFVSPLTHGDLSQLTPRFQATIAISMIQGLVIFFFGFTSLWFVDLFKVPEIFQTDFCRLFLAQCLLVSIGFPLRPFNSLLLAKQAYALSYIVSAASMLISLGLIWVGFSLGWSLWSIFLGNCFQIICNSAFTFYRVARIPRFAILLSKNYLWIQQVPHVFRESTAFASGSVFVALGGFFQSTMVSRLFDLEGVAVWNVGAKITTLLSQVISKFFESSFAPLSELEEQQKRKLMINRFLQLFLFTFFFAFVCAVFVLFFNDSFINWWTKGQILWPNAATYAMAFWLIAFTINRAFSLLPGVLLHWSTIRLAPLFEFLSLAGSLFIASSMNNLTVFAWCWAITPLLGGLFVNLRGLIQLKLRLPSFLFVC